MIFPKYEVGQELFTVSYSTGLESVGIIEEVVTEKEDYLYLTTGGIRAYYSEDVITQN